MPGTATPIIVGVGEFKNASKEWKDAIEPKSMMLRAIKKAFKDVKLFSSIEDKLRADVDSIDVVETWSWSYSDLPRLLANELKAPVKHTAEYRSGGNAPTKALDEAARRIANRECQVAIVVGGESIASRTSIPFRKVGTLILL
jgi:acetyl-CoA acetyltransferase